MNEITLRKNDPDNYWGEHYLQIIEEYEAIEDWRDEIKADCVIKMKADEKVTYVKYLYNRKTPLNFIHEMYLFRNVKDVSDPFPAHIAYRNMPRESAEQQDNNYVFLLGCYNGEYMLDIFSPHFWQRYYKRVATEFVDKINLLPNEYSNRLNLLMPIVALFLNRNPLFHDERFSGAMSKRRQENNADDWVTVFPEDVSYGDIYYDNHIVMHKTFVSRKELHKDQFDAIEDQLPILFDRLHDMFPMKYPPFPYIKK